MNTLEATAPLASLASGKALVLAVLRAALSRGGGAGFKADAAVPSWQDTQPGVFRSEAFAEDLLELA